MLDIVQSIPFCKQHGMSCLNTVVLQVAGFIDNGAANQD